MYRTRVVGEVDGSAVSRSMAHRNAVSVLPDPVGAITRVSSPSAMESHARACAVVGSAKVPVNHCLVSALKRSRGSGGLTLLECQASARSLTVVV